MGKGALTQQFTFCINPTSES